MSALLLLSSCIVLHSIGLAQEPNGTYSMAEECGACDKNELCGSAAYNTPVCRCDIECELYRDCCAEKPQCISETSTHHMVAETSLFQCLSIFLDGDVVPNKREAYWMVSACPEAWLEQDGIEGNCTEHGSKLPPVTDLGTGLVYRNEYCAICNAVENTITWSYRLACTGNLHTLAQQEGFVLTTEILASECEVCSFIEPNDTSLGISQARSCYPHVATCLKQGELTWWQGDYNETVHQCREGTYSPISSKEGSQTFRNPFCAKCNGVNDTHQECYQVPSKEVERCILNTAGMVIMGMPFSLILDIHSDGDIVANSDVISTTITVTCSQGEVFDPVVNTCRKTLCTALMGDICSFTLRTINQTCSGQFIQLNETEYEYADNSTIRYGDEEFNIVSLNSKGQVIICTNFSMNGTVEVNVTILYYTYPTGYLALTYIGCSLSVLGCALLLLTYSIFKELRTLPSKILMNLATTILISNVFILFGDLGNTDYCTAVAIILHMFFLAQFGWMSIMTFEMGRIFISANKLAPKSSERFQTKLFIAYLLVGWGIPLTITTASVAINFTLDGLILYGELEDGTQGSCWINHLESVVVVFITPLALSLLFTGIVFTIVTVLVCSARRTQAKLEKTQTVPYLRVYIAICSTTGLTWVFGFAAILTGEGWAWYPFILLNSTQGFLIFLAFICTKKIGKLYLSLIWREPAVPSTKQSRAQLHSDANPNTSNNVPL